MAWDIDSTPISKQRFSKLRNKLLILYFLIIAAVLGTFSSILYSVIAYDRNQQLNNHLRSVAASAAGTLEIIQHEYEELTQKDKYKDYVPTGTDGKPISITLSQLMGKYKAESVSQIVDSPLTSDFLGVEWYDRQRRLMVRDGRLFLETEVPSSIPESGVLIQTGTIRSFTKPAYSGSVDGRNQVIGYVRVTESAMALEAELCRLLWMIILGAIIVSGLATLGGLWLTRESLKPIVNSFEQLRQFTSDASHELRNPLTAIRASVGVMQSHPERVHPADVEKLASIAAASAQMSQLVDDLLLLARMDRQALDQGSWRIIALDELLEDLLDLYRDRAEQSQISLELQVSSTPSIDVYGDAAQLQRLFTNLLTNALQYTPAGGAVRVSVQHSVQYALVAVQDTGIGIAPEQLPHIFDRFWRADQARSYYAGGFGLGLSIAKAIAQCHQGDITVQSQLGHGSCFWVKIPLARQNTVIP
ncbi:MAG: sensor histidine kinase [Leptodesmis sp.]|uniref:sensor histidine kinase n=1 Tax=Leptodesmis sp. TaxID=3100501 RepID=UPI003D14186A